MPNIFVQVPEQIDLENKESVMLLDKSSLSHLLPYIRFTEHGDFEFLDKRYQNEEIDISLSKIIKDASLLVTLDQIATIFDTVHLKTTEHVNIFNKKGGYFQVPTKKQMIVDILTKNIYYVVLKKGRNVLGFCNVKEYTTPEMINLLRDVRYNTKYNELQHAGQ